MKEDNRQDQPTIEDLKNTPIALKVYENESEKDSLVSDVLSDPDNFEKLCKIFPNAVHRFPIMVYGEKRAARMIRGIDVLNELSMYLRNDKDEYAFNWENKDKACALSLMQSDVTLRLVKEESVGRDGTPGGLDTENIYIRGESEESLKALLEPYRGKIKMIYIDPPYNTGQKFAYNDSFDSNRSKKWLKEYLANLDTKN